MPDASAAIAHLLVDAGLASGRVWRPVLGAGEASLMPRDNIIVRRTGGGNLSQGFLPATDQRLDIRCYASSHADAITLERSVTLLLHQLRDVDTPYGRVLWCRLSGGAVDQVEADTSWPYCMTVWQVYGLWLDAEGNP